MLKLRLLVLACASLFVSFTSQAQYADSVISYAAGDGASPSFTNPAAALGEPSRVTPGTFGGPVGPFDPPYLSSQLVSVGAGGSLTVQFDKPILNHPNNLRGLDFSIFGNSGFIITNAFDLTTFGWIGTPATDGSLFGQNSGETRVSVSRDGLTFYALNPALAPVVDGLFPTDGTGDFQVPLVPGLTQGDFAGATLADIRTLYHGSAGGTSYNISCAQDANGNRAFLSEISFIRIEVVSGKSEIDGFATVARKPARGLRRDR